MAKVVGAVDFPALKISNDWNSALDEQHKAFAVLESQDRIAKENGSLIGRIVSFSIADGCAHYRIENDKPLELAHIPYMDGYHLPQWQLTGLNLKAIKQLLQAQDSLDSLFGRD